MRRITLQSPRVWDSTWGQEKDLARVLAGRYRLRILDLHDFLGRYGEITSRYGPPEGAELVRRRRLGGPALLRAVWAELANAWQQLSHRSDGFATYLTSGNLLAVLLARLLGRRVLLIYADDLAALYGAKSRLAGWLTRRMATPLVARLAHEVVATAALLADDIRAHNGRVTHLPNGVRLEEVPGVGPPPDDRFTAAFVGGFGEWVDFEAVLEAARAMPDLHFDLVGGGDRLEEVRGAAEGMANVTVPGRVAYAEVWKHVGAASVCLVPFLLNDLTHRVSPIKLFEYWAAGRPVVVSRTAEMQACAGDAVLYADGGPELVEHLSRLRDDHGLRRKLAAAGRERVREFDWKAIGARYLSIFGRLFGEGNDA